MATVVSSNQHEHELEFDFDSKIIAIQPHKLIDKYNLNFSITAIMVNPASYTVGYSAIIKELLISKNSGNPILKT
jgi:hypothetical protein